MLRSRAARFVTSLAATALLAACATADPGTTTGPTRATSAADPTSEIASTVPATMSAPTLFTAHAACHEAPSGGSAEATYIECETTASDPRMNGSGGNAAANYGDVGEYLGTFWSEYTIENAGGTWRCKELLVGSTKNGVGGADEVCVGEGGYTGLTAYMHSITDDEAATWGIVGWIEETR